MLILLKPLMDAALPGTNELFSFFPALGALGGLLLLLAVGLLAAILALVLILVSYNRKKQQK